MTLPILMLMAGCCVTVVVLTIAFPEKFDRLLEKMGRAFNNLTDND